MVHIAPPSARPLPRLEEDGWTVVTRDGSLSAQFEHTVAVTDDGCEVLTWRPETASSDRSL